MTATYDGKTSAETRSNALRSGYVTPPWTYDFSNEADIFNTFTRINNNSDTDSWKYYSSGWGANKNGMVSVRLNKYQATGEDWDKWLVSPNVKLIPGKAYRFNVKVKDQSNSTTSPHRVEVKLGTSSSDMETMTLDIVPQQDVTGTTWKTLEGYIRVDTENKYFVGIHVCTPANNGVAVSRTIYFDDFTIGLPQESSTPGQVADFSVTPAADGSHSATISFKAPSTDFAGQNPLASLDKVDIYRGEELIKTFEHPSFGQQLEYIDNTPSFGEYTYRVVGSNENGEGNAMSATVFVGVKLAASPENVTVFQTSNPGEVTLSWTPPDKRHRRRPSSRRRCNRLFGCRASRKRTELASGCRRLSQQRNLQSDRSRCGSGLQTLRGIPDNRERHRPRPSQRNHRGRQSRPASLERIVQRRGVPPQLYDRRHRRQLVPV